jgi:hypothetical protein
MRRLAKDAGGWMYEFVKLFLHVNGSAIGLERAAMFFTNT